MLQSASAAWPIMSNAHTMREAQAGSGFSAAPGVASWLVFAAAPTFATMALWTGFFSVQSHMLCTGMQNGSPLNEMALMYALMSAFHAGPWLKSISHRRSRKPGDGNEGSALAP